MQQKSGWQMPSIVSKESHSDHLLMSFQSVPGALLVMPFLAKIQNTRVVF